MAKIRPFICSASSDRRALSILISATEKPQLRHHHHHHHKHHLYSSKEVSGDLLFLLSCIEMKDLVLWPETFFKKEDNEFSFYLVKCFLHTCVAFVDRIFRRYS